MANDNLDLPINRQELKSLVLQILASDFESISQMPAHASTRNLWRLKAVNGETIILANLENSAENQAFIKIAKHLAQAGLRVPKVYLLLPDQKSYFLEDLGCETLFDRLKIKGFTETKCLYQKALEDLLTFQIEAFHDFPIEICYNHKIFDYDAMLEDLHYLDFHFFSKCSERYDKEKLQQEYHQLSEYLNQAKNTFLIYRDFQARNIMYVKNDLAYIDFQRACHGPLQYDVATLLFQSQAALTYQQREELLKYYLQILEERYKLSGADFLAYYYEFVLLRLCEVLGTYGRYGLGQKKEYFLKGIPLALNNINQLFELYDLHIDLPELKKTLRACTNEFAS